MKHPILALLLLGVLGVGAQQPDPDKQALERRLAAVKQSIAQNQARLKQYAWTETTEISLKGEVKKREQKDCHYGADGKLVKTAVGEDSSQGSGGGKKRGLRGKVIQNKIEDVKEYMDRVGSLVRRYLPPDPQSMQAAFQAGKASLDQAAGTLVFSDYAKPGDQVTLAFDTTTKKLRTFVVATYLDDPEDTVSVNAYFSSLADGTNFLEESVLDAKAKEIRIKTTNFDHRKSGS